jgi:heme/copper-type cytochrome/quinol oxidase subunit 4
MTIFAVAYVSIAVALALYLYFNGLLDTRAVMLVAIWPLSLVVTVFTTKYRPWRWH